MRPPNWAEIRDRLIEENAGQIRDAIPCCYPLVEATADAMYRFACEKERERLLEYLKALLESTPEASLATIDLVETLVRRSYEEG